jgi:hypothetical protein
VDSSPDQRGQLLVQRIAAGFQPHHRRHHATGERPVHVEVLRPRVEEVEPSDVRGPVGVEERGIQGAAHQVRGDDVLVRVVHDGGNRHVVQHPLHGGPHCPRSRLRVARGGRDRGGAGQVEQVLPLGVVELECAGDRVEDAVGGPADVPAFQPRVVVHADAGERGDLFAPQAGHAPFAAEVRKARGVNGRR